MSLNTKAVITSTPASSQPCGKHTSAPAHTPSVPTRVTALGLTPIRSRRSPSGAQTLVQNSRKRSSMAAAGYPHRHPAPAPHPPTRGPRTRMPNGRRWPRSTVTRRSQSGSRRWSQHERQVAAAEHEQEVHEVDQGEARREACQGTPGDLLRAGPPHQEEVSLLELGVIGRSAKENESRLPIHPDHLPRLDADVAARITLEHGYGARFGRTDAELAQHVAGFASREELLEESDVVLLLKPQHEGVAALRPGSTLWGWP